MSDEKLRALREKVAVEVYPGILKALSAFAQENEQALEEAEAATIEPALWLVILAGVLAREGSPKAFHADACLFLARAMGRQMGIAVDPAQPEPPAN
jgi:hypothetical protein